MLLLLALCLCITPCFPVMAKKAKYLSKRPNVVSAKITAEKKGKVKIVFRSNKKATGYCVSFFHPGKRIGVYTTKKKQIKAHKEYTVKVNIPKDYKKKRERLAINFCLYRNINDTSYFGKSKEAEIKQK